MSKRRPESYEFSKATRLEALRRAGYKCERCGKSVKEGASLEIHHVLAIAFAIRYYPYLFPTVVRSIENAKCYCVACHDIMDVQDRMIHKEQAKTLHELQKRQKAML